MERLNKYIASCGVCSRRKADELIATGKVKVNNKIITSLGEKVDINDVVEIENKVIKKEEKKVYIALNKPKSYVTTSSDEYNRKNVVDLVNESVRVYPIGRLDMDTEGLLLLTNDGEFANKITHPSNKIEKKYIVITDNNITDTQIRELQQGIDIGGYITKQAKVKLLQKNKMEIIISEGKNRQIRRMCEKVGINIVNLKRIQIGHIKLGNIQSGKYRYLTQKEIDSISK